MTSKHFSFKVTTNKTTGNKTYFINGKRVSKDKYEFIECMCTRLDSFHSRSTKYYQYDYKSGSY